MCLAQNNTQLTDHYKNKKNKSINLKNNPCRVCLSEGSLSIFDNACSSEIINIVKSLCNIEITQDDTFKLLCKKCENFVKDAVLFKNTVKQTHELLKYSTTEEFQENDSIYSTDTELYKETKQHSKDHNHIDKTAENTEQQSSPKIQCKICNKVINKSYYKQHVTMHDPDHYNFICDVCGKSFRLRCAYRNHKLRHRTDFSFKCKSCPYKSRYLELLKTHSKVHAGDYRYMCTECPARFLFKSNLNRHMQKHKEPQFKCDSCKRAFHTKLAVQRHYEVDHLGIRNHVCNVCGKAFGYRNSLMKHQRGVHKREKCIFSRMPSYLQAQENG
ncbi:unnamed protein product [Leptidea sinapis]|uniref:Protein krueppel n=1 Tax=Leptidea sinapis TaxID=189913 RepID=A0A5E4PV99_9NEOP|nr:unnamed protein product [Leptidea sinapis]